MKTEDAAALHSQLGQRMDRAAIRAVLYDDCRAVDRGDTAPMKACYHPDGTDDHGFFVGKGWNFADYVLPMALVHWRGESVPRRSVPVHGSRS